jgi:hypothetical protein
MDRIEGYRKTIKRIIQEVAAYHPTYGDVEVETVFDDEHGHYELLYTGWDKTGRVHGSVIHIDLRGEKVWLQHDGTNLRIAQELVKSGIPKEQIVLGFHSPDKRKYTDYAIA